MIENSFFPCSFDSWSLSKEKYEIALKAVSKDRKNRYSSFKEFHDNWNSKPN